MNWKLLKSLNEQEAKKVRPEILNVFWEKRIKERNEPSINLIKGFLRGRPPSQWNDKAVDRDQWSLIIDDEFRQLDKDHNKNRFLKLFEHISDMDILDIDKGERFGIAKQNAPKKEISVMLSSEEESDISELMADMNMSAAVSICSEGRTSTLCTKGNDEDSIFSIHSVGKIFTGILVLHLIEQGILKEEDLNEKIQLSGSAKGKLPDAVVKRLKDVTLHDVMVHRGGFGDFVGNYVNDVRVSLESEVELPKVETLEDFLLYANGCGLIKLSIDPTDTQFDEVGKLLNHRNGIIFYNDTIYYVDQKRKSIDQIAKSEGKKEAINYFRNLFSKIPENSYQKATPEALEQIEALTGRTHASEQLSEKGEESYSNLGSLLVGLAAEHACDEYQKVHPEQPKLNFNDMLHEFIQKPSGMTVLTDRSPKDAKVNISTTIEEPTPEARYLVGNPSGGYWTSIRDLQKFGSWLYQKSQDADFARLISAYGQEFHLDANTLGHKGDNPSASAMLTVSLNNGRVIAVLSNSSRTHAHELEKSIREDIFSTPISDSLASVKKEEVESLMAETDIPGLSMASVNNGKMEHTTLGVTSCGFYKVDQLPKDKELAKLDSSKYLLTDAGLYFYNLSTNELEMVTEDKVIIKNVMNEISKDPMFQKFNQIPALKAHQLAQIKKETGHQFQPQKLDEHTQFGAASLSKPVFCYLILKIIEDEGLKKELGLEHFDLNTKLVDLLPGLAEKSDFAKDITVGMVLSHQTGVHDPSQDYGAPEILFEPGSQFGYSGFPLIYLQMALEKNTGQTLEQLAKKYVFKPCEMDNSTFLKKGYDDSLPNYPKTSSVFPADIDSYSSVAANSLRTTAEDYAKFMLAWMNDESLSKYLTTPVVKLTRDGWANAVGIEEERLNSLAWGHGIGLQLEKGEVTAVFHNGDMNQWRAIITMNPKTKTGTVFFSNSHNGDVLTQEITKGVIDAGTACDYMRDKFGFAMAYEDDWEAKQMSRMNHIDLIIVGKNLEAAKLNLARATDQLRTAEIALENIRTPAHKPTGKNDQEWVAYEKNALKLSGNVTLAEERLKNAKVRYQNAKKTVEQLTAKVDEPIGSNRLSNINDMIDRARKNEPETGITGASEEEWAQEENDYKSSYSLMHRTLTLKSPNPAPKEPSKKEQEKTSSQSQRQEKEESVRTKSSEDKPYKPMTPFDSMYRGPKPEGHGEK